MCVENVSSDIRKRVLILVHETAKEKGVFNKGYKRAKLHQAVDDWVDELAEKHQHYPCKICGHTL